MSVMLRHIVALLLLVAYVASGQLSACVCLVEPTDHACATHDHSQEDPDTEQKCKCPTCHSSCNHALFTLSGTVELLLASPPKFRPALCRPDGIPLVAREIFVPPKVTLS